MYFFLGNSKYCSVCLFYFIFFFLVVLFFFLKSNWASERIRNYYFVVSWVLILLVYKRPPTAMSSEVLATLTWLNLAFEEPRVYRLKDGFMIATCSDPSGKFAGSVPSTFLVFCVLFIYFCSQFQLKWFILALLRFCRSRCRHHE